MDHARRTCQQTYQQDVEGEGEAGERGRRETIEGEEAEEEGRGREEGEGEATM